MRAVFDLDGTLIDSAPDIRRAANRVLEEAGARSIDLTETRGFIGHGAAVFVARMMEATGLGADEALHARLLARFLELYDEAVDLTRPYPGVVEALQTLRRAGWRLGLCTNKPERPTRAVLEHLGLLPFFDSIIGGDSLPNRKPDPEPLHASFAALGGGGVYVGDSEVDAETARRAGVPFILFTEGYRHTPVEALEHRARFSDFRTLPEILSAALPRVP